MTKKEFEERTRRLITAEDYRIVEELYLAAGEMDKGEFCEEMRRMCAYDASNDHIVLRECLKEIGRHVGAKDAELSILKKDMHRRIDDLADFLIGKAHAYDDTDLRNEAVRLVGEADVVKRTIELGLPLWEADRKVVLSLIGEPGGKYLLPAPEEAN